MTHLRLIGRFRRHGFCFNYSIALSHYFRPASCVDVTSWTEFLAAIEDPFEIMMYSGYCSFLSLVTHVADLDFLPLAGLRGVTTYHPLAVMG